MRHGQARPVRTSLRSSPADESHAGKQQHSTSRGDRRHDRHRPADHLVVDKRATPTRRALQTVASTDRRHLPDLQLEFTFSGAAPPPNSNSPNAAIAAAPTSSSFAKTHPTTSHRSSTAPCWSTRGRHDPADRAAPSMATPDRPCPHETRRTIKSDLQPVQRERVPCQAASAPPPTGAYGRGSPAQIAGYVRLRHGVSRTF